MRSHAARRPEFRLACAPQARLSLSLGQLLSCLQEITNDDRLVVAMLADMMEQGRLRTPVQGTRRLGTAA